MANFWQAMQEKKSSFTKSYRLIADYIEKHSRETAFLSIQEMSTRINVSTATIIRFCQMLGLSGYSEFQKEIQKLIRQEYVDESFRNDLSNTEQGIIVAQAERNIRILQELKENAEVLDGSITRAAQYIVEAERVYVMGLQGDFSSACELYYALGEFMDNVTLLTLGFGTLEDRIKNVRESDVLLIYSFRIHNPHILNTINQFMKRSAKVISIIDRTSPFGSLSTVAVIPYNETPSYGSVLKVTITRALVLAIRQMLLNRTSLCDEGGYETQKT